MALTHKPEVFAVGNLEEARRIILTPTSDASTDDRWRTETPYLADLAARELGLANHIVVIDYGCGIGRVSSALIQSVACRMLGVDASAQMRAFAASSEPSPRFGVLSRGMLEALVVSGFRAPAAIAVWVLQHIPAVEDDIALLRRAIAPGGRLLVVNTIKRAIPVDTGWIDDGRDIRALLRAAFSEVRTGALDPACVGPQTAAHTFWAVYRNG